MNSERINIFLSALKRNDIEELEKLLESGYQINYVGEKGYPPLFWSIYENLEEMTVFLVERGADLDIQRKGQTALFWSLLYCRKSIFEFLVERGANVNILDKNGSSLLHNIPDIVTISTAQFLIEKGALINVQDKHGQTPLHLATHYN